MHDALAGQLPELAVPAPGAQLLAVVLLQQREAGLTHPPLVVDSSVHPRVACFFQQCLFLVLDQWPRRLGATFLAEVAPGVVRVCGQYSQVFRRNAEDLRPDVTVPTLPGRVVDILDRSEFTSIKIVVFSD